MLYPSQIAFLGMILDSHLMQACLSQDCVQSLLSAHAIFKMGKSVSLKCFQGVLNRQRGWEESRNDGYIVDVLGRPL